MVQRLLYNTTGRFLCILACFLFRGRQLSLGNHRTRGTVRNVRDSIKKGLMQLAWKMIDRMNAGRVAAVQTC
jgi:hypothetical protein